MLIDYKIEYKEDTVYDYIGERESNIDIGEIPLGMWECWRYTNDGEREILWL